LTWDLKTLQDDDNCWMVAYLSLKEQIGILKIVIHECKTKFFILHFRYMIGMEVHLTEVVY
jgi:hypothetical protein